MRILIFPAVIALLSIAGCDGENTSLLDVSRERQCRANMNTLATDQANYRDALGHWAATNRELDQYARRPRSLTCPVNEEQYIIEIKQDGYMIRCPGGHGSIDTGTRSWTGGDSI